jgi:hypothetical protein
MIACLDENRLTNVGVTAARDPQQTLRPGH